MLEDYNPPHRYFSVVQCYRQASFIDIRFEGFKGLGNSDAFMQCFGLLGNCRCIFCGLGKLVRNILFGLQVRRRCSICLLLMILQDDYVLCPCIAADEMNIVIAR